MQHIIKTVFWVKFVLKFFYNKNVQKLFFKVFKNVKNNNDKNKKNVEKNVFTSMDKTNKNWQPRHRPLGDGKLLFQISRRSVR